MNRLVDYFIILGFDDQKQAGTLGSGKVLQRFPENDWPDVPLIDGLELFCQPLGWRLSSTQQEPSFFVSVMTYMDANKHYCAFLSFYEPISLNSIKQPDEEDSELDVILDQNGSGSLNDCSSTNSSTMYAPKCIVLQSRHNFVEVFKNCLETIYTVHLECMDIPLEKLVGNLLCIEVPSPGSQLKFSIGANDKQLLTMPLSTTVPVTGTTVVQLFERLNVHNVISLFTAVMTDNKILFQSDSYSLLYESCHALTSLMYPFVYSHVYIPLLPSSLLEMLSSPTPFIMGVHSSLQDEVEDLLDVIVVDLDVGCISIPDCIHLPKLDGPAYNEMVYQLRSVITPQLMRKDVALRSSHLKSSPPHLLDKEIRAIFVRLFAQMLQGYRTCLQIVRINPKPFITFHKASFLGKRNLVENEFVVRLLESMFFNSFVQERGTPYRASDLFDELYATMHDTLKREMSNPELVIKDIKELAHQLHLNEHPHPKDPNQIKIPLPTEGVFTRTHQPKFPLFKTEIVQEILDDDRIRREMLTEKKPKPKVESRIIAFGPAFCVPFNSDSALFTNSARRLEVMRNCINCIFEEKIQDARKSFPAVLRALKNKAERLALAKELAAHVTGNKCVLNHEQFDLIVRLMNCALQQDCDYLDGSASGLRLKGLGDVNGLAAAILPLSMKFCRRLGMGGNAGVLQFAYTCLQDHLIWENMSFWESTFYQNVEQEVTSLYGSTKDDTHLTTALDIAAEQIRLKPKLSESQVQQYASSEESTVYSQAVDYTHQIVSLKIPLDIGCHEKNTRSAKLNNSSAEGGHHSDTNSNFTGTGGGGGRESYRDDKDHEKETRDFDNESGFEEGSNGKGQAAVSEISVNVIKFLGRFVDKVCTDGGVTEDHIKSLHSMIPDIVAIHCNTLDAIYKESKNIPPVTKPKIITPSLLPGEDLVMKSLRAYLIPDGRDEVLGSAVSGSSVTQIPQPIGGPVLLPAEGAIFLTNYRVIFRGRPCDQYAAENVIVRSFPIATLVKEKKVNISSKYLIETIDQCIQEGLQLRSNIFELMKIAFDEEVSSEDIETLRKMINKARTPPNVFHMFAFTSQIAMSHQLSLLNLQKQKEKSNTFKGMAKKTLMRTAQMAGLRTKSRKTKYLMPASGIYGSKTLTPGYNRQSIMIDSVDDKSISDDLSIKSDSSHVHSTSTLPPLSSASVVGSNVDVHLSPVNPKDSRTLKKLTELSYVKDYQRLGLGSVKDILSPSGVNNYSGLTSPTSLKNFRTSNPNNSSSSASSSSSEGFRISSVNSSYTVAGSYPAFLAVPASISDDSLQRLSRCYKFCRFPVIVWKHPTSKGLLLRASSFNGKGVIGILKGGGSHSTATPVVTNLHNSSNISVPSSSSSSSYPEISSNVEQEKYFQALINLTPAYYDSENSQRIETDYSIPSLVLSGRHDTSSIASNSEKVNNGLSGLSTPPPFSKDSKKTNVMASFSRAMNNIRASGSKPSFGTIGHSMGKQWSKLNSSSTKNYESTTNYTVEDVSSLTVTSPSSLTSSSIAPPSPNHSSSTKTTPVGRKGGTVTNSNTTNNNVDGGDLSTCNNNSRKCIYIFGEKGLIKSARSDHLSNMIEFVPIEYHEVRQVKQSFKKLLKACCPSSCLTDPEQSFIRQVENSEWLNQLQTIMRLSSAIIDLIDLQGSTVTLCLEDDLDLVPQIVSVAELCLDPYYRTFEGFRVLIEKEWLAFGHRFSHRSNHTAQTITSGFAPIFLQFLDIVHQIMRQFPLSFQFNEYYLRFIAYHYVSCRFRTFLLDSEAERAKYGWPLEDATRKYSDFTDDGYEYDIDDDVLSASTNGTLTSHTVNGLDIKSTSFWDYAERIWAKSPIFYNFYYIPTSYLCPESSLCVLRPYCSISNLKIWDYYLTEQLNHGPSYDFEVVQYEKQRREEIEATEQNKDKSKRTIINASYDCTTHFQANCMEEMLEKVKNMEMELGKSNGPLQKWHSIWDRMEIPVINSSNSNKMINSNELVNRQGSIKSQILGRYARTVHHKKNTIDLKKLFSKRLKQKSNHPKLNNDIYLQ